AAGWARVLLARGAGAPSEPGRARRGAGWEPGLRRVRRLALRAGPAPLRERQPLHGWRLRGAGANAGSRSELDPLHAETDTLRREPAVARCSHSRVDRPS